VSPFRVCRGVAVDACAPSTTLLPVSVLDEIRSANRAYAAAFDEGELLAAPSRKLAVVTCMDARLDPAKFLGLADGDAHVIRNAGGVVTEDTVRSLAISHHLLGTEQALIVAHTDCGLLTLKEEELQERLGTDIRFHAFRDLEQSVRDGVRRIRESPLLADHFGAHGLVYDVATGELRDVD
jgi:carbonic anhydrase